MDDFDRDPPGRGDSRSARRDRTDDLPRRDPGSRLRREVRDSGPADVDDVIPARDAPGRSSRSTRDPLDSPRREPREASRNERARSESRPERYSDRFRRAKDPLEDDYDDRSERATRDPYDRLRRTANRPPRRVEPDFYDDPDFDEYEDDEEYVGRSSRTSRSAARRPQPRMGQAQFRSMSASLTNPAAELRPLVFGGLVAAASLVLLLILVAIRSGSAPAWIPLRLDAEGTPVKYGTTATIWRLPLFALFTSIMALGVGYWLRMREAFAVHFLAVGTLMVHGIVWIGVITLLW